MVKKRPIFAFAVLSQALFRIVAAHLRRYAKVPLKRSLTGFA
jgi:hypothetical protein